MYRPHKKLSLWRALNSHFQAQGLKLYVSFNMKDELLIQDFANRSWSFNSTLARAGNTAKQ